MPAARWKADGGRLRELREARDLSQRELARLAEVDPQTIADIESGKGRKAKSATLKKLAGPLLVDWEELLHRDRDSGAKRPAGESASRSMLDLMRFAERERPEPKLHTNVGNLDAFGVAEWVDTFTAPRVREGDRYYVHGEVAHQRGLSPLDEIIVDAPQLEGGRFEIARKVDAKLPMFTLDVVSRNLDHTRALQAHWRTGKPVKLIVRVFVTRRLKGDPDHVAVTNLDGGPEPIVRPCVLDDERWKGFELITPASTEDGTSINDQPQPWCLLVEQIHSTPT